MKKLLNKFLLTFLCLNIVLWLFVFNVSAANGFTVEVSVMNVH